MKKGFRHSEETKRKMSKTLRGKIRKQLKERFLQQIRVDGSGCWFWTGFKLHRRGIDGYGHIKIKGEYKPAHRVSYQLYIGKIPDDMLVLHSCHNPSCVNPSHLHLGNQQDNMNEMVSANRSLKGSKSPQSKITEQDVIAIRVLRQCGLSYNELAVMYRLKSNTICNIYNRKTWKHV
jgi:hypothetical protein